MADQVERVTTALADRYKIEREIGAGGMATVYRAEDVKHERKVALKVLRPELAAVLGGERFLREIKITARLNHPHILPLLDSGEADHVLFYVMPFVEGDSLRQRLNRETQLSIDYALRLAQQVAAALHHAHQQGVMHRDIKPENILLHEGEAMVADFGIALALNAAGGDRLTETGLSIGTPEYMSPEQASGAKQLDARSDVYALGCVLHEMLTGDPPFTGPSAQAVIARQVLDPAPNIRTVRPSVSQGLEAVVQRALAKAPADRWQSASELLRLLEAFGTSGVGPTPSPAKPTEVRYRRTALWGLPAALALIVAAVWLVVGWIRGSPDDPRLPEYRQLTYVGSVRKAAVSPNGQYLAYTAPGAPDMVFVQDLAGGPALAIADSIGTVLSLSWSPDGTRLGIVGWSSGRGDLYVFPRLGGEPQRVSSLPYIAWRPDGTRVASWQPNREEIWVQHLTSDDADSYVIPGTDEWTRGGDWAPQGDLFALITTSGVGLSHLWVLDLRDGTSVLTLADSVPVYTPRWAPNGDAIYYLRDDDLYRIEVDPKNGRSTHSAERVTRLDGVDPLADEFATFTLSADGRRLVYTRRSGYTNFSLVQTDFDDGEIKRTTLTNGTAQKHCPTPSPDGTEIAFVQATNEGMDLHRVSTNGGTPVRLTFDGSLVGCVAWAPSGGRIAFVTESEGSYKIGVLSGNGGTPRIFGETQVSGNNGFSPGFVAWAPASRIAYIVPGNRNFRLLDPETHEERLLVANDSVGWIPTLAFSPDGTRGAVWWVRGEDSGLWLISFADSSQVRVVVGGWAPLGWSEDGRSIYAMNLDGTGDIMRFPISGNDGSAVPKPALDAADCMPFERPDHLLWVCSESQSFADAWMIENFDPKTH